MAHKQELELAKAQPAATVQLGSVGVNENDEPDDAAKYEADKPEAEPYPVGLVSRTLCRYPITVMFVTFFLSAAFSACAFVLGTFETLGAWEDLSSSIVQQKHGFEVAQLEWYMALEDIGVWTVYDNEEDAEAGGRRLSNSANIGSSLNPNLNPRFNPNLSSFGGEARRRLLENSCGRTWHASEFDMILLFRDASGDILSKPSLKAMKSAQNEVTKMSTYQEACLHNDNDECVTHSPVNVAMLLNDVVDDENSIKKKWANYSSVFAKCLNIDPTDFAQIEDEFDSYYLPTSVSGSIPSKSVYEPVFNALCVNGTAARGPCGEVLEALRDVLLPLNWDCGSLEANYGRIYLPTGFDQECDGWYDYDTFSDRAASMIEPLFALKESVEADNADITMYFDFPALDIFFDHYLARDLNMLALSFALVFVVLWFNTNSVFLASCGMFEILVSFPLGLFIWLVLLQEPGVTYLMYNGIFIILGIGCDDIFVFIDAFRQSELEPPEISGSLETRFAWAYNRAAGAMLATSLTTCLAFLGCAISQIWDIRCFGVVNGMMVLFDYLLVITWFPAAVVVHERYLKNCIGWCTPQHLAAKASSMVRGKKETEEEIETEGHFMEVFFGGPFAHFIVKFGKAIVFVFALLLIGSTVCWTLYLKPASKTFTFFAEDHYYEQMKTIQKDKFKFQSVEGKMQITMAFGLKSSDPWDDGGEHPTALGEDLYEDTVQMAKYSGFDLFDYQVQFSDAAREFHDQLIAKGQTTTEDGYYCWLDDFKRWAMYTHGLPYPYTDRAAFANNVSAWLAADQSEGFSWKNRTWWKYGNYKGGTSEDNYETGFGVSDGVVRFSFSLHNTSYEMLENGYPSVTMWDLYNDAEDALKAAEAVSGMSDGIQTMRQYGIMALTSYLTTSAYQNASASLCLAVVVILLFTNNWWLTILCTFALYCVTSLVFAEMAIFGWQVNILEAVDISIAGGMSVDYVLHLAHSYNSQTGNHGEKVTKALKEMGVSVTSGMLTTFMACIALFMTDMLWFRLFGCFIAMVILSAFVTSMVGLMALLAVAGPGDGQGEMPCLKFLDAGICKKNDEGAGKEFSPTAAVP